VQISSGNYFSQHNDINRDKNGSVADGVETEITCVRMGMLLYTRLTLYKVCF